MNINENNVKKTFCLTTDQKVICDTFICLSMSLTKPSCFKNRNPFSSNSAYDTITYGLLKAGLLESEKRRKCELITLLTPVRFYLFSPSTLTYLVSDRVLSRIGKLFSLDHGAWYVCLWLWLGLHCLSKPAQKDIVGLFWTLTHIKKNLFLHIFFLFCDVQLWNSNQYPLLLLSADYVHALLWDVPTDQFLSAFDPQMRERSETGCVLLIIDPFLPEYSL